LNPKRKTEREDLGKCLLTSPEKKAGKGREPADRWNGNFWLDGANFTRKKENGGEGGTAIHSSKVGRRNSDEAL